VIAADVTLENAPPIEAMPSNEEVESRGEDANASEIAEASAELISEEVRTFEVVETPAESIAPTEAAADPIIEAEPSPSVTSEQTESASLAATGVDSSLEMNAAAGAPEPEMIEVWRPGRPEGRRRPRGEYRHARHGSARSEGANRHAGAVETIGGEVAAPSSAAAEGEHPKAAEQNAGESARRPHRRRRHGGEPPRHDRQAGHAARHDRHRPERREVREKAPDPNSPFAKLASLKAQLEADAKERR
jgi:ATP-dependent RNA helicase SUPV3L1/SUV3